MGQLKDVMALIAYTHSLCVEKTCSLSVSTVETKVSLNNACDRIGCGGLSRRKKFSGMEKGVGFVTVGVEKVVAGE